MLTLTDYLNYFDPITGQIAGAKLTERRLSQLEGCFADEASYRAALTAQADPLVYSVSSLEVANGDGDLHIGIGKIMPGRVGDEYFLTRGHLHAWREAAEIYIGLSGEGVMLLESETGELRGIPLTPHSLVYVPGHTAHRTVNTGTEELTYLGVYPAKAGHDYAAIAADNFQQVVVAVNGQPMVMNRNAFLNTLLAASPRAVPEPRAQPHQSGLHPQPALHPQPVLHKEQNILKPFVTKPIPTAQPDVALVERPWGAFRQYANNQDVTVSLMTVLPGQRLSLQSHTGRAELWIVLDDGAEVQVDDRTLHPKAGDEIWIPAEARHRLSSRGGLVRVLEVAFGNWQQADITRFDDDYARSSSGDQP